MTVADEFAGTCETDAERRNSGRPVPDLLHQIALYLPGAVLPLFVGLLTSAVFTRMFGVADYGRYTLALAAANLIVSLLSQWLQQGISRYLPGAKERELSHRLKRGATVGLALVAAMAVLIVVPAGIVSWFALAPRWRPLLVPSVVGVILSSVYVPVSVLLQAQMKAGSYSMFNIGNVTMRFLLSLLLVIVISREPASLLSANAIVVLALTPLIWRRADMPNPLRVLREWRLHMDIVKTLARYGVPMMGWFLTATVLSVGDRYIIQYFRGPIEVGIYSANYTLISGVAGLAGAPLLLAAHPFLMKTWSEGKPELASFWLGRIIEWFLIVAILLVGAAAIFSEDIAFWMLGPGFRSGHTVMPIVLAGAIASQIGLYTHKPLEFAGRTTAMFSLGLVAAFLNVALNILLVPSYGFPIAAVTTLIAYSSYAVLCGWLSQRWLRWSIRWRYLARHGTLSLLGLVVTAGLRYLVAAKYGGHLGFGIAVAGFAATLSLVGGGMWRAVSALPARSTIGH